jgi:hypothetical protein
MQQGTRRRQTSTMVEQTESFKQIHDLIYIFVHCFNATRNKEETNINNGRRD